MSPPADPEVDPRILRALGNPLRQQVLRALTEHPASAATLSGALAVPADVIRDHLACLVDNDAVEAVDEPHVPPDVRRYRATMRPFLDDAHWRALPPEDRQALFDLTLSEIATRVDEARAAGGFGHVQTHVSMSRLLLDEQGWQEITDLLAGVLEEAMDVEAESAARRARGESGELASSNLAILHFGRPERRSA